MQDARLAPSLLECLEAVYRLRQGGVSVSLGPLEKRLGLGKPLVMEKVLALQGVGMLEARPSGQIVLTAEGERIAIGLIRKHRLLERFFADRLGLPWDQVHADAVRVTPVLSDRVGDALAKLLDEPTTCPHGNPIPAADGTLHAEAAIPLHRLKPGQSGVILRIEKEEPELLRYLATLGLLPQTKVEVEEVAPLGGPILIRMGSARYALGRSVASKILVREA